VLDKRRNIRKPTQALGDCMRALISGSRWGLLWVAVRHAHEPRDERKPWPYITASCAAALRSHPSAIARYAFLQQKQNKNDEAMEQYSKAATCSRGRTPGRRALCLERTAQLDPENLKRQLRVAEYRRTPGQECRGREGFLRTAQLATAAGHAGGGLRSMSVRINWLLRNAAGRLL